MSDNNFHSATFREFEFVDLFKIDQLQTADNWATNMPMPMNAFNTTLCDHVNYSPVWEDTEVAIGTIKSPPIQEVIEQDALLAFKLLPNDLISTFALSTILIALITALLNKSLWTSVRLICADNWFSRKLHQWKWHAQIICLLLVILVALGRVLYGSSTCTSLVVREPMTFIDTLADLESSLQVNITYSKNLIFDHVFINNRVLYDRTVRRGRTKSTPKVSGYRGLIELRERLMFHDEGLVSHRVLLQRIGLLVCMYNRKRNSRYILHSSRETIHQTNWAIVYSPKMSSQLKVKFNWAAYALFESDIHPKQEREMFERALDNLGMISLRESRACLKRMESAQDSETLVHPIAFKNISITFMALTLSITVLASVCFSLEMLKYKKGRKLRRFKRRNVITKFILKKL